MYTAVGLIVPNDVSKAGQFKSELHIFAHFVAVVEGELLQFLLFAPPVLPQCFQFHHGYRTRLFIVFRPAYCDNMLLVMQFT